MSETERSLRRTIRSGTQLQSVVRTMKAVAASSIAQYEKSVCALADYDRTVQLGLGACLRHRHSSGTLERRVPTRTGELSAILFGSDQGLVGQFNDVVSAYAIKTLKGLTAEPQIWTVGERVHARMADTGQKLVGPSTVPNCVRAISGLVDQLQIETGSHRVHDENAQLWVFYNRRLSATQYEPVGQRLLPLDLQWQQGLAKIPWSNRNVPELVGGSTAVLRPLIREYLFISLFRACAESLASENASRLAAMQRADKNIDDLLGRLNASYNQLRQSGIDEELFDVISGFEALAGSK
jgi:F-type H+-transporting ATPase subunit gamma